MERRKFDRSDVELSAHLHEIGGEENPLRMELRQLGNGGCLLQGSEFLGVGRVFSISLTLPEKTERHIGKVLYEFRGKESEIYSGVEFFGFDDHHSPLPDPPFYI